MLTFFMLFIRVDTGLTINSIAIKDFGQFFGCFLLVIK